jgi:CRP-like cAMP-binding protein
MFGPLSLAATEQVASRLVPCEVADREALIREGDIGDRFYIVESGELEVRRNGRLVAVCRHGEYVGEIALLRDVPRTAAVTARGDARLYALGRADFLDAVTGHSAGIAAGHAAVEQRLLSPITIESAPASA